MQFYLSEFKKEKVFFIGVGGISMSALASFLRANDYEVGGSDQCKNAQTNALKKQGVKIFIGHNQKNVENYDVVVYTSAISNRNPELLRAKELGLKIYKRSELLNKIVSFYVNSIAVCGSHGKTTTTSLIYKAFNGANLNPTAFIGGNVDGINNFAYGKNDYLVIEACEYKKNFLDIKPSVSVVLNIDDDHVDTFTSSQDRYETFSAFTKNTICFYNKDDGLENKLSGKRLISFAVKTSADYTAKNIRKNKKGYSFTFSHLGKNLIRVNLSLIGKHNIYNALSALAVSHYFGLDLALVKRAIEGFNGVARRNEYLGGYNGLDFYADYAHHPSEITAYLSAKNSELKKSIVVFEPHTYSRTKVLIEKFISSLNVQAELIIYKTYSAREKFDYKGSAYYLFKRLKKVKKNVYYASDKNKLLSTIFAIKTKEENVLIIGAGSLYERIKKFIS